MVIFETLLNSRNMVSGTTSFTSYDYNHLKISCFTSKSAFYTAFLFGN